MSFTIAYTIRPALPEATGADATKPTTIASRNINEVVTEIAQAATAAVCVVYLFGETGS